MAQQEQGSVIGSGGGPASIFWADADPSSPLSLEQLRMRQKMAELLAQQRPSDNPTIGGGIQRIGEAIGSRLSNTDLDRQSAIYEGALRKAAQAQPIPGTDPAAVPAPPPEPPPPEAPSTRGVEPIPAAVPWVPPEASAAPPPDAPPPAPPLAGGGAGATPAQLLAGRDLLARTMLANPRGTAIPAPAQPVAPQGGGPLPPFSPDTVAAGGSSGTNRADEGTPPVLFNVPTRRAAASTRGVDTPGAPQIGTTPGPLTRPVPTPPPPPAPGTLQPLNIPGKPVPPLPDQRPTPEEIHGIKMMREHPLDPNYAALAKPWIEYGQQKRAAAFAQRQEAYKADLAIWQKGQENALAQSTPKAMLELQQAQEDAARKQREYEQFGGLTREEVLGPIKENLPNVKNLPSAAAGINNARAALNSDQGMFTGSAANVQLSVNKLLAAAGARPDPRIAPTEAFRNYVTGILGALRPQVAGTGSQSEAELRLLEQAAGANVTLDRSSINSILDAVEKLNTAAAIEHQKKVLTFTGTNDNARRIAFPLYGVPAMEQVVPDRAITVLKQQYQQDPAKALKEFDEHFYTPGLGQRVLQSGR